MCVCAVCVIRHGDHAACLLCCRSAMAPGEAVQEFVNGLIEVENKGRPARGLSTGAFRL